VHGVQLGLARGKVAAVAGFALRHDHLGVALVAAVGHDVRAGTLPVHTGVTKGAAVIAVARRRSAHRDGQPGVGIDHDLPVHRVPVVLTGCRHGAVVGGHQAAIDDPAPCRGGADDAPVTRPGKGRGDRPPDRQPIWTPRTTARSAATSGWSGSTPPPAAPDQPAAGPSGDRYRSLAPAAAHDTDQLDELPLRQARDHRHPLRPIRTQHPIHTVIVNNHDHRSTRHAVTGQPLGSA